MKKLQVNINEIIFKLIHSIKSIKSSTPSETLAVSDYIQLKELFLVISTHSLHMQNIFIIKFFFQNSKNIF